MPATTTHLAASLLKVHKLLGLFGIVLALADDVEKVLGQDEGDALPGDAVLFLEVPEKVTKVYVENLPLFVHHNVVRMPRCKKRRLLLQVFCFFNLLA